MRFEERLRREVWPRRGVKGWLGYLALSPLSGLFRVGAVGRSAAYRLGVLGRQRAPLPVISVGNLAVGGTGKTPFTLWLAAELQRHGLRVAILLRGYRGKRTTPTIVSSGRGPQMSPTEVGDEAVMIAKTFAGLVVIAPRRIDGARLIATLGCDVILLDDGFQHRALERCFDIVLVDGRRCSVLPAGPLRESPRALRRADAVVLVQRPSDEHPPAPPRSCSEAALYHARFFPAGLIEPISRRWHARPLGLLAGKRVLAVSGIAQPEGFYRMISGCDAVIDDVCEFEDHHEYTHADWQEMVRRSQRVDLVVTTEKDLVKLEVFPFASGKLVALRMGTEIDGAEALLERALAAVGAPAADHEESPVATTEGAIEDDHQPGAARDPGLPEVQG